MLQTHLHHLLLLLRKGRNQLSQFLQDFFLHEPVLHARSVVGEGVENVEFVRGPHHATLAVATEMVNGCIVGDPHDPGSKLPFFHIPACLEDLDHLDPNILEQIVGDFFVAHHEMDLGEHSLLVAVQQGFKGAILPLSVGADQLSVCAGCMHDTTLCFMPIRRVDPESKAS